MLKKNKKGFSLLEMLAVTAIISIFFVVLLDLDLGIRHRFNKNEVHLELLSEGRDFFDMLQRDIKSGATCFRDFLPIDKGETYIQLESRVTDPKTGVVAEHNKNWIVYYVPHNQPNHLVRTVVTWTGQEPYEQKVSIKHLKSITVLQRPTPEQPLLDVRVELEKRIALYPPVTYSFREKIRVYL